MTKVSSNANRRRGKDLDARHMNSIVAAASTARDLDEGHKVVQKAERELAIAKKLAGRIRGR